MRRLIPTITVLVICALTTIAQTLSDDFSDGVPAAFWMAGTGFSKDAINYYPSIVTASESGGVLTFTHPGPLPYWAGNAYSTIASYDVRNSRVSVKIARNGLDAWLAVGTAQDNMVEVQVRQSDQVFAEFQTHVGEITATRYLYVFNPDAYIGLRFSNKGVYCETSPDGINWTIHGLLKGNQPYDSAARIEIGAGMFRPQGGAVMAEFDDLKLEP